MTCVTCEILTRSYKYLTKINKPGREDPPLGLAQRMLVVKSKN